MKAHLWRWWVKWRYNGSCPCPHDHGETPGWCACCYDCNRLDPSARRIASLRKSLAAQQRATAALRPVENEPPTI